MIIFLAGGESYRRQEILIKAEAKAVLVSYLYLQKKGDKMTSKLLSGYKNAKIEVMVDSGAHTFFDKAGISLGGFDKVKYRKAKAAFDHKGANEYVQKYYSWLKLHKANIDYAVELDIQSLVGKLTVAKWRQQAKDEKIDLIPCWHEYGDDVDTMEDWKQMCKDYKFIAIEGGKDIGKYVPFMEIAKEAKALVHAFAMTKAEHMRKLPFYSVDSTSWISGSRFGTAWIFKGGKLISVTRENKTQALQVAKSLGIDKDKLMEWKGYTLDLLGAYAWVQYSQWIDERSKKYWKSGPKVGRTFAENKGRIMQIREDPSIEKKRTIRHKDLMKGNTHHWIHGQTSKYHPTPKYLHKHLSYLDKLDLSDKRKAKEAVYALIVANLKRITLNQWFELADGGVQDKQLSNLIKNTVDMIMDASGMRPQAPGVAQQFNIDFSGISKMKQKDREILSKELK